MSADAIRFLPPSAQEKVLGALARVLAATGPEAFLGARILLPDAESFPDRLPPRGAGVTTLIRRLSAYAGLPPGKIRLSIEWGRPSTVMGDHGKEHHPGDAVAWFTGVENGTYGYAVRDDELDDLMSLLATLAGLVAYAYLRHRGLRSGFPPQLRPTVAEYTAVTLGFGALLLEGSFRTRTEYDPFLRHQKLAERRPASTLSPERLAYLLAVQLVVRGHSPTTAEPLLPGLSHEHGERVAQALRALAGERAALAEQLGLTLADDLPRPPPDPDPLP